MSKVFQPIDRYKAEDEGEREFVPLRKKLKRKSSGKEDNFVQSYYSEPDAVKQLTEDEVIRLRWEHGIKVSHPDFIAFWANL